MTKLVFIKSYSTDLFWRVYERSTKKEIGFLDKMGWKYIHWSDKYPYYKEEVAAKIQELSLIYT